MADNRRISIRKEVHAYMSSFLESAPLIPSTQSREKKSKRGKAGRKLLPTSVEKDKCYVSIQAAKTTCVVDTLPSGESI